MLSPGSATRTARPRLRAHRRRPDRLRPRRSSSPPPRPGRGPSRASHRTTVPCLNVADDGYPWVTPSE